MLYSLDYLKISLESIYKKFFIKDISFKINDIKQIKELFYILLILKLINSDIKEKENILNYFKENNSFEKYNFIVDPIIFLLLLQIGKEYKNLNQDIKNNINKLIQELIEKKIDDSTHNKNFKLIFLYYGLIINNKNFNKTFFERKIIIKYI